MIHRFRDAGLPARQNRPPIPHLETRDSGNFAFCLFHSRVPWMPPAPGGAGLRRARVGLLAVKAQKADDPLPAGRFRPPGVMQETHDLPQLLPQLQFGICQKPAGCRFCGLHIGSQIFIKRPLDKAKPSIKIASNESDKHQICRSIIMLGIMRAFQDMPAVSVALVIIAALLFFVPSMIAQRRRVRSFRSISALNALMMLTLLAGFAWTWLLWATGALWLLTTAWATAGGRRDA